MTDTHNSQKPTFNEILQAAVDAADQRSWELAAGLVAQAIPLDSSAGLIIQYGHMLKEAGYLEAAARAYRAALIWDGTASDGYVHLGHLLKRLGRADEAIETFVAVEGIPYGPHVRPEINGLRVARLNASHAVRGGKGDVLPLMPDNLRHQDEALQQWLAEQDDARRRIAQGTMKSTKAAPAWSTKCISSSLEPLADLVLELGVYRATTHNPRMRLQLETRSGFESLRNQWLKISLKISETECVVDPILYIEEAPGWERFKTARLEKRTSSTYGAIIRLPQSIVSLRLDPIHTPGKFNISDLEVSHLSWSSVLLQLLASPDRPAISDVLKAALRGNLSALMDGHFAIEMADEYARWIAFNERSSPATLLPLVEEGTVGFVSMVNGNDAGDYVATLTSLRAQASGRWKLALVLDESVPTSLRATIELDAAMDVRIEVSVLTSTASTAARIEAGMSLLDAGLIGLLPLGDVLANEAVSSFLQCAKDNPAAVAFYCDHDEIDEKRRRLSPRFKPDWNMDYILCYNYVGHTVLFSRSAIDAAGGWRDKFPRMEAFDLLLRVLKNAGADGVRHIAKPVWHCRQVEEGRDIVPTVNDFLTQQASGVRVEPGRIPGTARLAWPMPAHSPHVTIIIPTRDRIELLKTAIDSVLLRTEYPSFDIIVVDNGSVEPESLDYFTSISQDDRISIVRDDGPFNFSRLNNRAAAEAKGSVLALVNNDVEVGDANWLLEMVSIAIDPGVGAVGAKLLYGSGHVQHAGIIGGVGTVTGHGHKYEPAGAAGYMNRLIVQQEVLAVTAACLVIEADKYKAVGGLNEENLTVAFNDVDLCLKLRERGWRSVFTPWASLFHHESVSRGLDLSGERAARFKREAGFMVNVWGGKILNDRFYSQNLTLDHEDFSLRCQAYK
ncbi:glycosyltransferase family 2 protein [Rhizobium sp. LjRoot98]|uniref:glycosyltransferase family 2 protein n=1 Tax=Rhizobium sp. LjRoot98 TaxID=3342345 RepID=UPI003ECDD359